MVLGCLGVSMMQSTGRSWASSEYAVTWKGMYEGVCQYSMRVFSGRPLLPSAPIWTRFVFTSGKSKVRRVSPWMRQVLGALLRNWSSMGLGRPEADGLAWGGERGAPPALFGAPPLGSKLNEFRELLLLAVVE